MFLDTVHPLVGHAKRQTEQRDRRLVCVLAAVRACPCCTVVQIAAQVGLPVRTTRRLIAQLVNAGEISRDGSAVRAAA